MDKTLKIWQNVALSLLVLLLFLTLTGYSGKQDTTFDRFKFEVTSGSPPQVFLFDTKNGDIWWYKNFKPEEAHWSKYAPPLEK